MEQESPQIDKMIRQYNTGRNRLHPIVFKEFFMVRCISIPEFRHSKLLNGILIIIGENPDFEVGDSNEEFRIPRWKIQVLPGDGMNNCVR